MWTHMLMDSTGVQNSSPKARSGSGNRFSSDCSTDNIKKKKIVKATFMLCVDLAGKTDEHLCQSADQLKLKCFM